MIWSGTPFWTMNFLAGMQAISQEMYEAAEIDGAGTFQRFWYITLPSLQPVIFVTAMLSTIWTSANLTQIFVLTGGGPNYATTHAAAPRLPDRDPGQPLGAGAAISMLIVPFYMILVYFLTRRMLRQELSRWPSQHSSTRGSTRAAADDRASAGSSRPTSLLIFFTLWTVVPFFWMFLASVKTNKEIYQDFTFLPEVALLRPLLRPAGWHSGGKASAYFWTGGTARWSRSPRRCSRSSSARSAPTRSPGSSFPGRAVIARGLVFTYLLPASLLFIPLFQIVARTSATRSSSLMLVYPTFTLPFCTWMLMSYFKTSRSSLKRPR